MAGREFGPPPNTIDEFGSVWRNWLYLLYKKIYKRTFFRFIQVIDGIGDGNASNTMQEGLIGIAPVALAPDNKRTDRNFAGIFPEDWVPGTDIEFGIAFANTQAQTGVKNVVTEINYESTAIGEDLSLAGTSVTLTSSLPNNVAANILHLASFTIAPAADATPGKSFHFVLTRIGDDADDTCNGDVGYKEIVIKYTGFINHE